MAEQKKVPAHNDLSAPPRGGIAARAMGARGAPYLADLNPEPLLKKLVEGDAVSAMAHITGGGITGNLPRMLPKGTAAVVEMGTWPVQTIFQHLQQLGSIPQDEMMRTFNMGIGMILVIPPKKFKKVQTVLERAGEKGYTIGRIVKGERKVLYT